MIVRLVFLASLFLLAGCKRDSIYVRSEYINHNRLASVHVGTPDYHKAEPFYGKQIIVRWNIPANCYTPGHCTMMLSVLSGDYTQIKVPITIDCQRGTYIYRMMNCDYTQYQGILTYKVELFCDDTLIEQWTHHTWADWIDIEPS
ncbi:MAG: hypothetical protein JHC93_05990 [Parachlamydiales bacterium]|nr:hypothetical protein [Parachlamydiales bacterium]